MQVTYHSITRMAAYQGKSFEELRWEHYSEDHTLEAQHHQLSRQRQSSARAADPAALPHGAGSRRQGTPRRLGAAGGPRLKTRRACPHPPLCHRPRAPSPPR